MRGGKWLSVLIALLIVLFLAGLALLLYPYAYGYITDYNISLDASEFLSWVDYPSQSLEQPAATVPTDPTLPSETKPEATEARLYPQLWEDMNRYNESIYVQGQSGLSCEYDYQVPSFKLADYGLDTEIFGVITIPAMDLEMPIYLGATNQHMADGAALMSQTSLPIGGSNTNAVIAGHRGYNGASYFRYIDKLRLGDEVIITNLWETITYEVVEIKIIYPYEVQEILIREGKEMVTLLTCHPYASGGRQRYLVFCERSDSPAISSN